MTSAIDSRPASFPTDAPITRLSDELLVEIFMQFAAQCSLSLAWMKLSEVCRLWRALIVTTALLWARITLREEDSVERIRLWLARAQKASLTVEAPWFYRAGSPSMALVYNTIWQELDHIRAIDMKLARGCIQGLHWPSLSAPAMREISFTGMYHPHLDKVQNGDGFSRLTHELKNRFPKLTSLSVQYRQFYLPEWSLPSTLTKLFVHNAVNLRDLPDQRGSTVATLLSVLQSLPSLVWLELTRALPDPVPRRADLPLVPLPHLQYLNLFDRALSIAQLLAHLVISPDTHLRVALNVDSACSQLSQISDALGSTMRTVGTPLQKLRIVDSDSHHGRRQQSIAFVVWKEEDSTFSWRSACYMPETSSCGERCFGGDVRITFEVEEQWIPLNEQWTWDFPLLETLYTESPLTDVLNLRIDFDGGRYLAMPRVYAQMNNVRMLHVCGRIYGPPGVQFVRLLEATESGDFNFPELELLVLKGMDFVDFRRTWMHAEPQEGAPKRFLEMLQARTAHNLGPKRLVLNQCNGLTREDMERWQEVVEIDWDKWESQDPWVWGN